MMLTDFGVFPTLQILEGVWLELRNSKGVTKLYPLLEDELISSDYTALDPIVLHPGKYWITIFNDSTPIVNDILSIDVECILFNYKIDYQKDREVTLSKSLFIGTEEEWYCEMEI